MRSRFLWRGAPSLVAAILLLASSVPVTATTTPGPGLAESAATTWQTTPWETLASLPVAMETPDGLIAIPGENPALYAFHEGEATYNLVDLDTTDPPVAGNVGDNGIYALEGNTATLEATLWGAGDWANTIDWDGGGTIITGTVNVWGDPAFVDPVGGDYHVGTGSAAVDAGIDAGVTTDIDGETRPLGDGYDIGADEVPPTMRAPLHPIWEEQLDRPANRWF